jgi:hypothetical protein
MQFPYYAQFLIDFKLKNSKRILHQALNYILFDFVSVFHGTFKLKRFINYNDLTTVPFDNRKIPQKSLFIFHTNRS